MILVELTSVSTSFGGTVDPNTCIIAVEILFGNAHDTVGGSSDQIHSTRIVLRP